MYYLTVVRKRVRLYFDRAVLRVREGCKRLLWFKGQQLKPDCWKVLAILKGEGWGEFRTSIRIGVGG